ncbi:hypothetical protein [Pseudoalteromonas sp. 1_2015MBL_MicDiv]|uniref:hypothetical protein n=1 Tax=Pseudoalteromonas sp. 1_2015MBL_MicDiv TaxID=1720343 RepID=UPI000BBE85F3|nr:hypothetical protein [Pseudoalteromonas sp. 1_2015MBL_MicDiv]ATG79711.1 hypothetical protein AOR04_19405 [Pseudoalteromonas sp. 1_2015MBL_MicDiv]
MELAISELPRYKRWPFKFFNKGLYPGIYSVLALGYIGIPTNIQEMVRHQLPIEWRTWALNFWDLEQWFTALFITAFIGAIWGGIGSQLTSSFLNKIYRRVKEENEQLKEKNSSTAINCYELFSHYIYNNYFAKFGLTSNERLSLYKLDMDLFLCVGRYSENELYRQKPNRLYPRNVGCIETVWKTGKVEHVIPFDSETEFDKWKKYNIENYRFEDSVLNNMKMRSRAFLGFRIQNSQKQTIAVLIFESTQASGLKFSKINTAMTQRELQNICHLLESLDSHMPSLQTASMEGF